jgi:hypothetical protein
MAAQFGNSTPADTSAGSTHHVLASPLTAVVAIWVSAALTSVFAPDMITGAAHEHLPMAAMTVWIWAAVATGYVLMGARGQRSAPGLVSATAVVWGAVLVTTVFAPSLVTGTDPTTIPVSVFVAPVAGAVATGFIVLYHRLQ